MDTSIFMDKAKKPGPDDLSAALGKSYRYWQDIEDMVQRKYPGAVSEWNFPGPKYGWSFRIKDSKRAIVYLLPRDKRFMAAFVFGAKAFGEIMKSDIQEGIKRELEAAKVYAEGRGIRIEVANKNILKDIGRLIDIKLAF